MTVAMTAHGLLLSSRSRRTALHALALATSAACANGTPHATTRAVPAPHPAFAIAPSITAVAPAPPRATAVTAAPRRIARHRAPQFVLLGIDGSPGPDTQHTFARRVGDAAEAVGAHVTFFVNTQNYMLGPHTRPDALAPDDRVWIDPGTVNFGRVSYATSLDEIRGRVATANYLLAHGHEIGSHGVHHENGRDWTVSRWREEHRAFARFERGMLGLPAVAGFRAPYLIGGSALRSAERDEGMLYDATSVQAHRMWPWRWIGGHPWVIGVMSSTIGDCRALIFDDGLRSCRASDREIHDALRAEFDRRYHGDRAPMILASHQGFVEEVYLPLLRELCALPDVRCVTYAALAHYLDAHPRLASWGTHDWQQERAPTVEDDEAGDTVVSDSRAEPRDRSHPSRSSSRRQ